MKTMKIYTLPYQKNNIAALHEELQTIFGERYDAMGSSDEGIWFRFKDDGQPGDEDTLRTALKEHDPDQMTERQSRAKDRPAAFERLYRLDVNALRQKVDGKGERDDLLLTILDALEDLQKLLQVD